MEEKLFSVSDYIQILNQGLKGFAAKIMGEVSEISLGPTGHAYFTLKDEKDESIIKCVIWKSVYDLYGVELKEGVKIIATGCPEVYAPWGRLSFKCRVIEHAGEGVLKKEYEKLKAKLTKEGLFEESRKKLLPQYPQRIGLITSKHGAVLADFLNNLARFGFKIKMIDSRVEGQAAVADLLNAIKAMKKEKIEVLVIMRGGGSLESMLAFNNEFLVREITDFPVPVIAAIGHHKDMPLAALAADLAVSTPSMAAIALCRSWEKALTFLKEQEKNVIGFYGRVLENAASLIDWKRILSGFSSLLVSVKQQLEHSREIIGLRNPETQLRLGYSIVRADNGLIRSVKDTKIGQDLEILFSDGDIVSSVKKINKKYDKGKTRY